MNNKQIGNNFEKEAYKFLLTRFDKVIKNNPKNKIDFTCFRDGKKYLVEAKSKSIGKAYLKREQKDNADYVVLKGNYGIIQLIGRTDFKKKFGVNNGISIQVEDKTWQQLNKRKKVGETFDEVIQRLILEEPEIKRGKK